MGYHKLSIEGKKVYFDSENFNYLSGDQELDETIQSGISEYDIIPGKKLKKLIVLVNNKCNMACKYCIAEGGTYLQNKEGKQLDKEVFKQMFSEVLDLYPEGMAFIQFFGGEPLFYFDTIKDAVESVEEVIRERNIQLPRYSIVTNGTLLTKEVRDFLKEKNFSITVSLDGTQKMHDSNRVFLNGKGTYDNIMKNLRYLSHQNLIVEYSFSDASIKYFRDGVIDEVLDSYIDLGFRGVVSNVIYTEKFETIFSENESTYKEMLNQYVNRMLDEAFSEHCRIFDFTIYNTLIALLTKKVMRHTCTSGVNNLTISTEGKILPCYLSSNIMLDAEDKDKDAFLNIREMYTKIKAPQPCSSCWCQNLCSGWCKEMKPDGVINAKCTYTKVFVEGILSRLYVQRKDKASMTNLVSNVKEYMQTFLSK